MKRENADLPKLAMRVVTLATQRPALIEGFQVHTDPAAFRAALLRVLERNLTEPVASRPGLHAMERDLDEALDRTADAMRSLQQNLADAHSAAAAVSVTGPTDEEVAQLQAALGNLNRDIQGDERLRAILNLLASIKNAIDSN